MALQFGEFGLTSVEHETHEKYFYGTEHWNYFSNDDDLGPVILSLKQENVNGRDQGRTDGHHIYLGIFIKDLRNFFLKILDPIHLHTTIIQLLG